MESLFAGVVGLFFATAVYLMLSKTIVRILIGVAVFGNAVNLFIFTAGRLTAAAPPILSPDGAAAAAALPAAGMASAEQAVANPLPQALILTAIVISFSVFAFLLVLAYRTFEVIGTDEVDAMRAAEPAQTLPPLGY